MRAIDALREGELDWVDEERFEGEGCININICMYSYICAYIDLYKYI